MALISLPYTFSVGNTIIASQHNSNFSTIYNDYNGNITDANIAPAAAIEYTKLALNNTIKNTDILSSTVFSLGNIPTLSYSNITQFPYVKCSNTQSSGTAGGAGTTGSFQTYPLNTTDSDTGSISTLTSNQVILPSGTYKVNGAISFYETGKSQSRLYNVTGSAILLNGTNCVTTGSSQDSTGTSTISGVFTVSVTTTIAVQYQIQTHSGTSDLGLPFSYGSEVYGYVDFTKVA